MEAQNSSPVVFPVEDNPWFPLPPNYPDLPLPEQSWARRNAASLNQTPALALVAWDWFRRYYLESQPPGVWFQPPFYPCPPCHYSYIYDIHKYPRLVEVFPRSFAKTMLMLSAILLWACTRPFFKVLIVKSGDDFVAEDIQKVKYQLEHNERIVEDFGILKPKRGEGQWSQRRLFLTNGFQLVGRSVKSTMLGFRPRVWFVDDAEFDPAMQIAPTSLTEHLRYLLFNHLEPMLDQGCIGILQGTLHGRRTLLYQAGSAQASEEPRWRFYHRVILPAELPDGTLTWPEKFSRERLQEKKESLGPAAYAAQMLNRPGTESERVLQLHPLLGQYEVLDQDDALEHRPLSSGATLVSWTRGPDDEEIQLERDFGKTVSKMDRAVLVDPAFTNHPGSDYTAIIAVGREHSPDYRDTLWVLDLVMDRLSVSQIMDATWAMALKWRVRVVGMESVAAQQQFLDKCRGVFLDRAEREGWAPRLKGIDYKGELRKSKGTRIMGLTWRFEQFRLKLPRHLREVEPMASLYHQIEHFTPDLKLLQYDDALDALAMYQFLMRPRGNYKDRPPDELPGPLDLLRKGVMVDPVTRFPTLSLVRPQEIPLDVLRDMQAARSRTGRDRHGRRNRKPVGPSFHGKLGSR